MILEKLQIFPIYSKNKLGALQKRARANKKIFVKEFEKRQKTFLEKKSEQINILYEPSFRLSMKSIGEKLKNRLVYLEARKLRKIFSSHIK